MKKLILSLVFVFAMGSYSHAQDDIDKDTLVLICGQNAWNFGTMLGQGNPYLEWYWTNFYYEAVCEK